MSSKAPNNGWWRGGVIYQIYPRSFQDSNGDGIGDLPGITQRLDHIAALGADGIWISPFFKSPMKDFGYDVSDYCDVDPMFGTLDDFKALVARAHALGLKVMIDQVLSHTSIDHAWFRESRQDRSNPKADWYVWVDPREDGTPPNNWLSLFGGGAWQWEPRREQYYLHNFLASQPDLNFHCEAVQQQLLDDMRFWLEMGVDGFRLDAANFYFHDQQLRSNPPNPDIREGGIGVRADNPYAYQRHLYDKTQPENLAFLARLRALADSYGDRLLLGEIGDDRGTERQIEYTSGNDRLHMAYSFDLLTPEASPAYLGQILRQWIDAGDGTPVWAIGNHDVPRVATRWAGGGPDPRQPRMFAAFLACLPGPVCIYQGDELGLDQVAIPFEELRDPEGLAMWPRGKGRDGCRTPMVWEAAEPHAGFSTAASTWLRIGGHHCGKAADRQSDDPESLLALYRRLLSWRRGLPAFGKGRVELIELDPAVLAWSITTAGRKVWCIFNFTSDEITVSGIPELSSGEAIAFAEDVRRSDQKLLLGPFGFAVFDRTEETVL